MLRSTYRRLSACAAICLLAVAAKAQIVYFGNAVAFTEAPTNGGYQRYLFDITKGNYVATDNNTPAPNPTATDFRFASLNHSEGRVGIMLEYFDGGTRVVEGGWRELANLPLGTTIDGSNATGGVSERFLEASAWGMTFGQFSAGSSGYMGLSFNTDDGTHYGWMQLSISADGLGLTVNQWAYNSVAGQSIAVGAGASAIPEPSTYAAMAGVVVLGATVVVRRRRQSAAAA